MNMIVTNMSDFNKENPGLIEALKELTSWNSFAASLVEQYNKRGSLSEKQVGAAVAMLMKIAARKTERDNAPELD